jgi:DNA-binding PadR family transcriptional regulator
MPMPPGMGYRFMGGGRRRGRGRARRGDIRAAILLVLDDRPMHGYEVMNELTERSGGMWRPSPGSVYPTLQQLEDEGLVRPEELEGKRVYRLTEAGQAEAEQVRTRGAPWDQINQDLSAGERSLYKSALRLSVAASQVAQSGSPEQVAAALEAIEDARKRLYRVLAEDAPPAPEEETT